MGKFNGSDYDPKYDDARLSNQLDRVFNCMKDGKWRGLEELVTLTGAPHASISAQLRHLRKERFGGHIVEKRIKGDRTDGLYEYKLIINIKE
jgi:hypothetical protein